MIDVTFINGEARKTYIKGVGDVVVWFESGQSIPLRAFFSPGAADEFRDMINEYVKDNRSVRLRMYAKSYDPTRIYDYPKRCKTDIAILKKISANPPAYPHHLD